MTQHSKIVGGSSAKRVINCPGSVALAMKAPEQPPSEYAIAGTLLHEAIAAVLDDKPQPTLSDEAQTKLDFALNALNEIDPDNQLEYAVEQRVSFGDFLPGVFGSVDLIGRIGNRVILIDWKFGSGVTVNAEDNEQLMFYAAAAKRTPELAWVFKDVRDIELIIVQPPVIKRWVTTFDRINQFELELKHAVEAALHNVSAFGQYWDELTLQDLLSIIKADKDARLSYFNEGVHCRWCPAKEACPKLPQAAAIVLTTPVFPTATLGVDWLNKLEVLENWISDMRAVALKQLESGAEIPGWKLVAKRATRKWVNEQQAKDAMIAQGLTESEITETSILSPAQAEKVLKKYKLKLPEDSVVSISSGNTLAPEDDPRPAIKVVQEDVLATAFKKIEV